MNTGPQSDSPPTQDAYSAVRWSAASRYGAQAVQFAVSLFLARLLAPEYFGLISMAAVATDFGKTLKRLGFNAVIIQRDDVDHVLLSTLFWINLALCGVITLGLILLSPLVALVYQNPTVAPVMAALSLPIFIGAFSTIPSALLQKRMEFKRLALRETGGVVVAGGVGVWAALAGWGVWALVASAVSLSLANVVLLYAVQPFIPAFAVDRIRLRECLKFGLNITGTNFVNYFSKNTDSVIIGLYLGPAALGCYSIAYKLMLMPCTATSGVVARVLLPKLASLKSDDQRLSHAFLRTVSCVAMITFPAMACLAMNADLFVGTFLTGSWSPAINAISLLAPVGAVRSIVMLTEPVYLAKGRADWMFRWHFFSSLCLVPAFFLGVHWGVSGVALCYLLASLLLAVPALAVPFQLVDGLDFWRLRQAMSPILLATFLSAAVTIVVKASLHSVWLEESAGLALATSITSTVAAYGATIVMLRPPALSDYASLLNLRHAR